MLRGKVNRTLKIRMIKTLIMKCGSVWFRNMNHEERRYKTLETFEMWTWRRMEKISWTFKRQMKVVLETIGEERSLKRKIKSRQKKWIGHTLRRESLPQG